MANRILLDGFAAGLLCVATACAADTAGGGGTPAADMREVSPRNFPVVTDEFRIKREEVFAFIQKPTVTREGDKVTIDFESKGFCDATIAIEDANGKIVRHLVSGVLGANAPDPFQKNAKKQTVLWDGKDDRDAYVDDAASCTARVSLGLKPQFERNLFWAPHRRIGSATPILQACDEGMLVMDGEGVDHLTLFGHDGSYLRTIYPFAAARLAEVQGLNLYAFPQDGQKLPLRQGHVLSTLLTSGRSSSVGDIFGYGRGASGMAVFGNRIALVGEKLNRLSLAGGSGSLPLGGPRLSYTTTLEPHAGFTGATYEIGPRSAALSPDGKWLYLTCYFWSQSYHQDAYHAVVRVNYEKNDPPVLWKGTLERGKTGNAPEEDFAQPMSVACDSKGRVYVADYLKDRIQVFEPDGKFLKSIPTPKPVKVALHPRTQEIYVFSWLVSGRGWLQVIEKDGKQNASTPATLTHLGPLDDPAKRAVYELPFYKSRQPFTGGTADNNSIWAFPFGWCYGAEIDFLAPEPMVWLITDSTYMPFNDPTAATGWDNATPKLYAIKDGKLELRRDTSKELVRKVLRAKPAPFSRQRLCVNPATGCLYLVELDAGVNKNFCQLLEFNPQTGKSRIVELPCHAEDICFDIDGFAYLRVDGGVARFDSISWREIPWDYGEEKPVVMFSGTSGGRSVKGLGVLAIPGRRSDPFWHLGGMDISPRGHLAVTTWNGRASKKVSGDYNKAGSKAETFKPYAPPLYPGRYCWGEVHVFDKHGKVIAADAFPGLGHLDGLCIDRNDNLYAMVSAQRLADGKPFFAPGLTGQLSETLVKARACAAKVISPGENPVPITAEQGPQRAPDIAGKGTGGGNAWVEGADWFYGGVGYAGMSGGFGGGCCCWNARSTLDYFARSFAPEVTHSSVAVLDTAGNLILRVGRYGNVDDGKPLIPDPESPSPRSISGDEVSLFHAPYVATHSDRRLYIADPGNGRVLSVKLGYQTEEKIELKNVPSRVQP